MNEKKATPKDEAAPRNTRKKSNANEQDNSAPAQRARVLEALRTGPKSTLQLRRLWDILAPAARVLELKRRGFEILTMWVHETTDSGNMHRVALYVLQRESGGRL